MCVLAWHTIVVELPCWQSTVDGMHTSNTHIMEIFIRFNQYLSINFICTWHRRGSDELVQFNCTSSLNKDET